MPPRRAAGSGSSPSPSPRRAWIEIGEPCGDWRAGVVALHPEGVDRNPEGKVCCDLCPVALHPEGVDRNAPWSGPDHPQCTSPSTRRAWIEILFAANYEMRHIAVALHPEGVDRNYVVMEADYV